MVDLCVQYNEETYFDITNHSSFNDFRYIAFNITATEKYTPSLRKDLTITNPIPIISTDFTLLPKHKQLRRITITLETVQSIRSINTIGEAFDIVAVNPTTERTFVDCCASIQTDLITFNLHNQLQFRFHVPTLRTAINRGVFFEINLNPLINSKDGVNTQRFISNATDLVLFTKGKNIILSSGATSKETFKGPYDLVALGVVLGLTRQQAIQSVFVNPMKCITRGKRRFPLHSMAIIN
ncbi:Ribonuclease P protein subunit p30 [Entamoeba marina]